MTEAWKNNSIFFLYFAHLSKSLQKIWGFLSKQVSVLCGALFVFCNEKKKPQQQQTQLCLILTCFCKKQYLMPQIRPILSRI